MKLETVFHYLGYLAALILIQTVDNGEKVFCVYDELGDYVCRSPTIEEKIVLSTKYFAAFSNSVVYFTQTLMRLFEMTFVEQRNAVLENLSLLSDMYNYGSLITSSLIDFACLFKGEPEFPD